MLVNDLNGDQNLRDSILGITESYEKSGGIQHFSDLSVSKLEQLFKHGFLHLDDKQNNCPSIGEIYEFLVAHPDFTGHGYAVDATRNDYRISLEGVRLNRKCTEKEWMDFKRLFNEADEISGSPGRHLYCWFD